MAWLPGDSLVIGISSRALLQLDKEDHLYRTEGPDAFIAYQRAHEEEIIPPGVAFELVRALLGLNQSLGTPDKPAIEVVVVSKNHPDCGVRIVRSLAHHKMVLRRALFTGGQDVLPYVKALDVDLFLSKEESAVRSALAAGISAGLIYGGPLNPEPHQGVPVLAFDGDAVLFSDAAERVFQESKLEGFAESELRNATVPLPPGPLSRFARALEELRTGTPIESPLFRIALVTARDLTFCERPIRTLRSWGIRIDQGFFVSDMSKGVVLAALKPLIFFDDSKRHCDDAAISTNTARVLPLDLPAPAQPSISPASEKRPEQFTAVCKLFLKKNFAPHESTLLTWHEQHLGALSNAAFQAFVQEARRSVEGTPRGLQRRASAAKNEDFSKLIIFLENLLKKHQSR